LHGACRNEYGSYIGKKSRLVAHCLAEIVLAEI